MSHATAGAEVPGLLALEKRHLPYVFPPAVLARLRRSVRIDTDVSIEGPAGLADPRVRGALARAEILITGWGCPPLDETVLAAAPRLRAVVHTAGTVKGMLAPAFWKRGIRVTSAATANALPVAEYTLAMVLLAGKDLLGQAATYRAARTFPLAEIIPGIGNYQRRIAVVGASRIGRRVIELLRPFDLHVTLTDPYVDEAGAAALGVRLVPLDEALATSDIVTVHAPATPETHHLVGRRELALMPDGAVLINTARGSLVDPDALLAEVVPGRLNAILDVTEPEPLPADSPLFTLPNVLLTPHIAGSQGAEVARLGLSAVTEIERLAAGLPPLHPVEWEGLERAA
ncbi:hydroxyacid dehydrogenase [Streptomyces sp. NPDC052225]|uniref:hydroxyacid dehydrogenase n=1 Tax=Streptomyces sp. NPDC052225 TaxID=3154949 RepID=UPI003441E9A6